MIAGGKVPEIGVAEVRLERSCPPRKRKGQYRNKGNVPPRKNAVPSDRKNTG